MRKKAVRKQSSSRVSTLAARLLRELRAGSSRVDLSWLNAYGAIVAERDITRDVKALCASVLSQDETRGQAKGKRRRK